MPIHDVISSDPSSPRTARNSLTHKAISTDWIKLDAQTRASLNATRELELRTRKVELEAEVKKAIAAADVKRAGFELEKAKVEVEGRRLGTERKASTETIVTESKIKSHRWPLRPGMPISYLFFENGFQLRRTNARANLFRQSLANASIATLGILAHNSLSRAPHAVKWVVALIFAPVGVSCIVETGVGIVAYLQAVFRGRDAEDVHHQCK
ncbi:hypothetical protein BC830DRAFT_1105667 [Chytriomyces sp. MP71]|nr:hypothetical protein BC830DRAFT_1105667 [Chytriomyces sp. MP71]